MILESRNLKKYFDLGEGKFVHAVDDICLSIKEREIVGLVGESGSGKSTLGKVIAGLHSRNSGELLYKGDQLPKKYSPKDFLRLSSEIQMIFQDPYSSLNPRMTVEEIVGEGLRLRGMSKSEVRPKVIEYLEKMGLDASHMGRYPHEFSGGQRQRIGIARALIVEPKFIVCDEPISALDVSVQAQIVNLLGGLQKSLGLTLLFIAHDLSMVRYISDRIAVMYMGAMMEVGPADDVFFDPMHPYTKMLIAANPEADPKLEKARGHNSLTGEIPSPVNVPAGCRFAARCPEATPRCREETPRLKEHKPERYVACHLYEK